DYAAGRAEDEWAGVTRKKRLDDADKRFMLQSFFSISWDRFVRKWPRYERLLELRNKTNGDVDLLSDAYWRDLAVLYNLAWIEPTTLAAEPELRRLVDKGARYSSGDA